MPCAFFLDLGVALARLLIRVSTCLAQLSYIRMSNPMRSSRCNHIQCFDAASWFQINEQTPTWTCPICEQALKIDHLFIDESVGSVRMLRFGLTLTSFRCECSFTSTILKTVPSSVDEVVVEPNAQWHTADKKYGDPAWLQAHAASRPASAAVSLRSSPLHDVKGKGKAEDVEVFTLDSDDEGSDVPLAIRYPPPPGSPPPAPRYPPPPGSPPPFRDETPILRGTSDEPIDLTFSSDEDEPPARPPPPRRPSSGDALAVPGVGASAIKRSATEEATSESDKRPRYDPIAESNGGVSLVLNRPLLAEVHVRDFLSQASLMTATRLQHPTASPCHSLPTPDHRPPHHVQARPRTIGRTVTSSRPTVSPLAAMAQVPMSHATTTKRTGLR